MAQDAPPEEEPAMPQSRRPVVRNALLAAVLLLLVALAVAWWQRKSIARHLIARTLARDGIAATYRIDSISPGQQVLSNIVIGNPAHPDLVVKRAVVSLSPRFGLPRVKRLSLRGMRLYGTLIHGKLSFGSLDPLIFTGSKKAFALPAMDLTVTDGRALIEGDHGPVGISLDGSGNLQGGFSGELAAVAPRFALSGCKASNATLYGTIGVTAGRPRFKGPIRFADLSCSGSGFKLAQGKAQMEVRAERNLANFNGTAKFASGAAGLGSSTVAGLSGKGNFFWRDGGFNMQFDLSGRRLVTGMARMARLSMNGSVRARDGFSRLELDSNLDGRGVHLGEMPEQRLVAAQASAKGTLLAPLLEKFGANLRSESRNSRFTASLTARRIGNRSSLVVPDARLRGASGATLLAISRGQVVLDNGKPTGPVPLFSGNFATGGRGLPHIKGRMEQAPGGPLELRMKMRDYSSGKAMLAIPGLGIHQTRAGDLRLDGTIVASGAIPDGEASNLAVPISGVFSHRGELALWTGCTKVSFDQLKLANLALPKQDLTLCPAPQSAILRYGRDGLRIAVGAPSLKLEGKLGATPIRIASGPIGMAYPGAFDARRLDVSLGPKNAASRFLVTDLRAQLSSKQIGGSFAGADIKLAAVPLDAINASGKWRYDNGRLVLSHGNFTLEDRQQPARFNPLVAHGATLDLANDRINTAFVLRYPKTGAAIASVNVTHDLANASGHATFAVDKLTFGPKLQPLDLSNNALGVVADVKGSVSGKGRIDWNANGVTDSRGTFSTRSLDLAAAFGPVTGAAGTLHFTDLLGLTTAPDQKVTLAKINPGIEVDKGVVHFSLTNGQVIHIDGASWPFMGGRLTMQPVTIRIGAKEERRYEFDVKGLDAALFVQHMQLNNIDATGTFDGSIPIVFDANGNGQIEGGELVSRPPGGHVSYVGALTYKNLSTIANFTFSTLRDLKYRKMAVTMNGPLIGEMVTKVSFEGISQGPTAKRNFITKQIGRLPIRLVVNIRAPFYRLITSFRSMYDPSTIRDPRSLGLIGAKGQVLQQQTNQKAVEARDAAAAGGAASSPAHEPGIQPPESEKKP